MSGRRGTERGRRSYYLNSDAGSLQSEAARTRGKADRCYHHKGMRPQTIGRVLGIGVRVTGRIVGQRLAGPPHPVRLGSTAAGVPPTARAQAAARATGQASRGVAKGVGGFLRPFRRVGGIVWLEVTGVFFLLPVLVFAPKLWQTRASWNYGPDHRTFIASAIVVVVFLYLGVTSFWRARRRSSAQ